MRAATRLATLITRPITMDTLGFVDGRHRMPGPALKASYSTTSPVPIRPRHCAGTHGGECINHDHARGRRPVEVAELPEPISAVL